MHNELHGFLKSINFLSLNDFDFFIFCIIILSTGIAVLRGFIKSFISFVGWILAFVMAARFSDSLVPLFLKHTAGYAAAEGLAFAALFIGSAVIIAIINSIICAIISSFCGGLIDRSVGLFFGFIRGCLLSSFIFLFITIIIPGMEIKNREHIKQSDTIPHWLKDSESILLLSKGADMLSWLMPENFKHDMHKSINGSSTANAKQHGEPRTREEEVAGLNKLLTAIPHDVIEALPEEDILALQDKVTSPHTKVEVLEKIGREYQDSMNNVDNSDMPKSEIRKRNVEYHKIMDMIDKEIKEYNRLANEE